LPCFQPDVGPHKGFFANGTYHEFPVVQFFACQAAIGVFGAQFGVYFYFTARAGRYFYLGFFPNDFQFLAHFKSHGFVYGFCQHLKGCLAPSLAV
jgi:hypothetical protein